MKWFKHDTDAVMSEGIDVLIDQEGFAGYGRWNRLLEIVAFKMDDTDRCHVEYTKQKWGRLLGLKQKKLISFLELTENQLKTKVVVSDNIIRISIPNLLKKRDNYTKHLQVKDKPLVSKDREEDKVKEEDKKPPAKAVTFDKLPEYGIDGEFCKLLTEEIERNNEVWKRPKNYRSWLDEFRRMREIDNLNSEYISGAIQWAQADDFWRSNILSPKSLRKQFPKLWGQAKRQKTPKLSSGEQVVANLAKQQSVKFNPILGE